jgi:hypothetical protein
METAERQMYKHESDRDTDDWQKKQLSQWIHTYIPWFPYTWLRQIISVFLIKECDDKKQV